MENHRAAQLLCQMYLSHFDKQEKEAITTAIEILQKFDWVDVNEELPKKSGDYLVTCNDGNIHRWWFVIDDNLNLKCWKPEATDVKPIAWMPLPKRYENKRDTVGKTDINMCLDCPMSGYSNQGRPYCIKEKRHLDSFSYIPIWSMIKTNDKGVKL